MRRNRFLLFLLTPFFASLLQGQTIVDDLWVTNGNVRTSLAHDGILYVGGDFSYVGPPTGHSAVVNASSGRVDTRMPRVDGLVYAVASDGDGGWYLGGHFGMVGGEPRANLVHIRRNRSLNPNWNPGTNGTVRSIHVTGGRVYVAGEFTTVAGQVRNSLAALDPRNGTLADWNPNAGDDVICMAIDGQVMYIGGQFVSIGGQPRTRLAAVDLTTGLPTSWTPSANANVRSIAVSDGVVYVGGEFIQVNGTERFFTAALEASTGNLTSWDPHAVGILDGGLYASGFVNAIEPYGGSVYLGGDFINILDGTSHSYLAGVNGVAGSGEVQAGSSDLKEEGVGEDFTLDQNYPNPFNPVTQIEFSVAGESHTTLTVYNALGEEVARLMDEVLPAGKYRVGFNGSSLPSGVYYYRVIAGGRSTTKSMVLMK